MKKIILLACCMVLFSIGVCNADSDIEKLKGCWRSLGIDYEIGDNYYKKLSNNLEFELILKGLLLLAIQGYHQHQLKLI